MILPDLPAGIYKHYKGKLYLVLGYAHDANADQLCLYFDDTPAGEVLNRVFNRPLGERIVVVYVPLELDPTHTGPRLCVRTLADFRFPVCWDFSDGACYNTEVGQPRQEHERTQHRPRFVYHGAAL